jgi:phenylalanyl-tRNA synthetase beta chain
MSLTARADLADGDVLSVAVPPTRPDVLHECDVMEDAAIAYGFNRLPDTFPTTTTVAQPLAISKLCDIVRDTWAMSGWVEVLPLILVRIGTAFVSKSVDEYVQCSYEENFAWLNRPDDGRAVRIANPKTAEFQVVRTTLLPVRVFETSDVVFKDSAAERQARNERHAAAVWCNKSAGFEVVHGMLDRIMQVLEVPRIGASDKHATTGYYIQETTGKIDCFQVNLFLTCIRPCVLPWTCGNNLLPLAQQ